MERLIERNMPSNSKLQILKDEETGTFVYRSVNPTTGEVLKQWPSESLLHLKESIRHLEGLLVDHKV